MRGLRFALAVLGTSLLLVVGIGAAGAYTVSTVLAQGFGPFGGGPPFGGPPFGGHAIPPELQGFDQMAPAERFKHFTGAQLSLKDKDGNPMTINVTPGTVTTASATTVTVAANDGSSKTFAINDQTVVRAKPTSNDPNAKPSATTLKQGDLVVVVAKNNEQAARFIMSGVGDGTGWRGGHGPWGGR
jgi:hypothetical protein